MGKYWADGFQLNSSPKLHLLTNQTKEYIAHSQQQKSLFPAVIILNAPFHQGSDLASQLWDHWLPDKQTSRILHFQPQYYCGVSLGHNGGFYDDLLRRLERR
jgi:hypothetical protein